MTIAEIKIIRLYLAGNECFQNCKVEIIHYSHLIPYACITCADFGTR
jgi:hypothetical protein